MSLWWMDSMDGYSTAWVNSRYLNFGLPTTIAANGRTGTNALNFNSPSGGSTNYVGIRGVSVAPPVTLYVGMALYVPSAFFTNVGQYATVYQLPQWGGASPPAIRVYGDGSLQTVFGGAIAPSGTFPFGAYHYVEMAAIAGASTTEVTLWVDDNQVADVTVASAQAATITSVLFGLVAMGAA